MDANGMSRYTMTQFSGQNRNKYVTHLNPQSTQVSQ